MIEKNIPRDISKYEAKFIGPLTLRQIVCFVPGALLAVGTFFLLKDSIGDAALLVSCIVSLPILLCGFWKPYGIPLERFVKSIAISTFVAPSKRKYVVQNSYDKWFKEPKVTQKSQKKKKKSSLAID